jgi:hypothetical protein
MRGVCRFAIAAALAGLATPAAAQVVQVGVPPNSPLPVVVQPAPSPVTALELFQPAGDSMLTVGHEILGGIGRGRILVEVRDMRDSTGRKAGGVMMTLVEGPSRNERIFIDFDEFPALFGKLDALLKITANPTQFKRFESRFTTRGNLSFVAYANSTGAIDYALQVNKLPVATISGIDSADMLKLQALLEQAQQNLTIAGYEFRGGRP